MEGAPRLTEEAVREIWELSDGPGTIQPVLQVVDLRPVTTKNRVGHQSKRYHMLLSDGAHSQQAMLATNQNHLVKDGTLRLGSIVHLHDITYNTIQNRRPREMTTVPESLVWELEKKNNCFLIKQFDISNAKVLFSKESNNLYNVHSYKFSGLVNSKTMVVQPSAGEDKFVVLSITKTKIITPLPSSSTRL